MVELPRFMRRREVRALLNVSDEVLTKLIENGQLKPRYLTAKSRAVFVEAEVSALIQGTVEASREPAKP